MSQALGREMECLVFGHYGPALLAFPSAGGQFYDLENFGMLGAIKEAVEAGQLKVYCPTSIDWETWLDMDLNPHERAIRHEAYEAYIIKELLPFIYADCGGNEVPVATVGCSFGGFHAANFVLKYPKHFHHALCLSGRYELEAITGPCDSLAFYFNNILAYVSQLEGDSLKALQEHTSLTLVCGQGPHEGRCLPETKRLASLLARKKIPHTLDLWGYDVSHSWLWWRRQLQHHAWRFQKAA